MRALLQKLLRRHRGGFLVLLFLVAVSVRVAFVLIREEGVSFPDSAAYDAIARNFQVGRGLILDEASQVTRPPLYPIFLAICYEVFGRDFLAVRLVQAMLGALTCVVVLWLGEETLDPVSARIGSLLVAVDPFQVFFCSLILTETLFTLLLTAGVWLLARARRGGVLWAAAGGAAIGGAILVRASLSLFWGVLLPFWFMGFGGDRRRAGRLAAVGVLATGLVLTPWVWRNYRVTGGHIVPTTLQVGRSLYEANSPWATGGPAMDRIDWEAEKGGRTLSEYEDNRFFRDRAVEYMRRHPGRTAYLAAVKFLRFWNVVPNDQGYRSPAYVAASLLSYVPVLLFAGVGVMRSRRRWVRHGLLWAPVGYFCVLHMVFVGSVRYRTPVMPFVMLLAGDGIRSAFWPSNDNRTDREETDEEEA